MSTKRIIVIKFLSCDCVATRQSAHELYEEIMTNTSCSVELDFSGISHGSRGFFNEFYSFFPEFHSASKQIHIQNLNEDLTKLFNVVRESAKKSRTKSTEQMNARNISI